MITQEQAAQAFLAMIQEQHQRTIKINCVDQVTGFTRDVTSIIVEVPNETLEDYARRARS